MYDFYKYDNNGLAKSSLTAFLKATRNDVISFSGAGGKTLIIKILASELINRYKVLITTTTKMFLEQEAIISKDINIINDTLKQKHLAIIGKSLGKKMGAWEENFLEKIISYADITLIEADGAKRLPFKMPRENEPVYINKSNKVVYIVGMTALGQTLKNLARSEILEDFLQKMPTDSLTVNDIIKVLLSDKGARKDIIDRDFYVILNQVDDIFLQKQALFIAKVLVKNNINVGISRFFD